MRTGARPPVKATIRDKTAERAFETVYQNLTGRPLLVIVSAEHNRANQVASQSTYKASVSEETPPLGTVANAGLAAADNNPEHTTTTLVFPVPRGNYYNVKTYLAGGGAISLISWYEVEL